jgi:transcriptional regulator with GAF, ATPase, and Fis domain
MSIWLCAFGNETAELSRRVAAGLAAIDLVVHHTSSGHTQGPAVVVFAQVTAELCAAVAELSHQGLQRVVAIATSSGAVRDGGWRLLGAGAADVLHWDGQPDPALALSARLRRWAAVDAIVESRLVQDSLVGRSAVWIGVLRRIVEVARFSDSAVLITGESGTGKELVARLVHTLDTRSNKRDLIITDCTTIVPELAGSELFGHERGAFTGAASDREGAFALANGGTLFLDEIGELSLPLQAELLRAVQEGTYKRVGGNTWRRTKFRLVSATNRDLVVELDRGGFRRDLYYRIASWTCTLPPLRDRPDDVLALVHHFARQLLPESEIPELEGPVRDYLLRRPYPGNVRDLKRIVTEVVRRHVGPGPFTIGDIPEDQRPAPTIDQPVWPSPEFERAVRRAVELGVGLKDIGRVAEDLAVGAALEGEANNVRRAAAKLQVTDRALQLRQAERRRRWRVPP